MPSDFLKKSAQGSVMVYAAFAIETMCALLLSIILVRHLSVSDYGHFRLIGALVLAGTCLVSLGLEQTMNRFGAELYLHKNYRTLWNFSLQSIYIRMSALVIIGTAAYFAKDFISRQLNFASFSTNLFIPILLILVFKTVFDLWGTAFSIVRFNTVTSGIISSIGSFTKLGAISLALVVSWGVTGIAYMWAGVLCFLVALYLIVNIRWYQQKASTGTNVPASLPFRQRIFSFATLSYGTILLNSFRDFSIDLLIIAHFLSTTNLAHYAFAAMLIMMVVAANPASLLRATITPLFIAQYTTTKSMAPLIEAHTLLTKTVLLIAFPLFILLGLLGDTIITYIFNPEFLDAYPLICCMVPFFMIGALSHPFIPLLYTLEKNKLILIATLFSGYNLLMDILLVTRWGTYGVAIATGSTAALTYLFYIISVRHLLKIKVYFPFKALLQTLLNMAPGSLAIMLLKSKVTSLQELMVIMGLWCGCYIFMSYINKIFDAKQWAFLMDRWQQCTGFKTKLKNSVL